MSTIEALSGLMGQKGALQQATQGARPFDGAPAISAPGLSMPDSVGGGGGEDFAGVLAKALNGVNDVHKTADGRAMDMVEGKDVPIHDVMVAVSEAEIAVQLTTAIAAKAIAAYQEIWRMDV